MHNSSTMPERKTLRLTIQSFSFQKLLHKIELLPPNELLHMVCVATCKKQTARYAYSLLYDTL